MWQQVRLVAASRQDAIQDVQSERSTRRRLLLFIFTTVHPSLPQARVLHAKPEGLRLTP